MTKDYTTILTNSQYKLMANAIRALTIDAVEKAKSGHPGMPLGMADVVTMLYSEFMQFNPKDPEWPNRDRLILSAGHGSMLLYALLYLTSYEDIDINDIKNFRQLNAKTAGHPEYGLLKGIETTTGPLGQGIANAVGMAISAKKLTAHYGQELVNHKIYTICGDGCLMEGISQEAISLAGHLKLNNLILIFDDNKISIDGSTELTTSEDILKRFESVNWQTMRIDGHDFDQIRAALFKAQRSEKPFLIAAQTKIGYGSPNKQNSEKAHGAPLGKEEAELTKHNLQWPYKEFEVPQDVLKLWQQRYLRNIKNYDSWMENAPADLYKKSMTEFKNLQENCLALKKNFLTDNNKQSTRKSSGYIIDKLVEEYNNFIGGSADLTSSNCTKSNNMQPLNKDNYKGNYIFYGVREHAMVAIMNGIALHHNFTPYSGTFLTFSDYAKPAIRLAALMKQKIILIMTHDSIGLGEDGPTHQPIEHLAMLRAIPNLNVIRPCDKVETIEAWQYALTSNLPTILCLTRQDISLIRNDNEIEDNKIAKGAYIIRNCQLEPQVTIYASGSEVEIAIEAYEILTKKNIATKVVSMASFGIFDQQSEIYKKEIIDDKSLKVAVEAGIRFGWDQYIGKDGIFIGMNDFGLSAPAKDLYQYFAITSDNIVNKILDKIKIGK